MKRLLLLGSAVVVASCFSADDFSHCEDDEQCGRARLCVDNTCVFPGGNNGGGDSGVDPPGDVGGTELEEIVLDGERLGTQDFPDAKVILEGVTVPPGEILAVHATVVVVRGPINADGAGDPGGGGGGGGGGGHDSVNSAVGEGGRGAEEGRDGRRAARNVGGAGGGGGKGGGGAGGGGGAQGTFDALDGRPGDPGMFRVDCDDTTLIRKGSGGGGGGGGAGGPGNMDCGGGGGGGGGGGAGGRGGGVIVLTADLRVEVESVISAKGQPGEEATGADADGGVPCPCGDACDASRHGKGGAGGNAGDRNSGPGAGGGEGEAAGGGGGRGGAGSGGMVRLEAPEIVFGSAARIDVNGGDGAANGGLVRLAGAQSGNVDIVGVATGAFCEE